MLSWKIFLLEAWWTGNIIQGSFTRLLFSPRMRVPGGILFAVLIGPGVARLVRGRFLQLADHAVPAAAASLVAIRVGCFLEGCCFGPVSTLPWAVSFPRPTEVFAWQVNQHLIPATAPASLPVQPLQLYFAGAALIIAVALLVLQGRKRFDGEILLVFLVAYLWSTGLLEFVRPHRHDVARSIVLVAAALTSLVAVLVESRVRANAGGDALLRPDTTAYHARERARSDP
jgi:prolipoprotein diacylglyceryltransferase